MKIDLGTYELDCDFDPREQFNNDKEKLPIEDKPMKVRIPFFRYRPVISSMMI